MSIELFSGVELEQAVDAFPRGASGNVVEILNDTHVLVEMFADGESVDVIDVPVALLRVVRDANGRHRRPEPAATR